MTALDVRPRLDPTFDLPEWTVAPRRRLRQVLLRRILAIREIGVLTFLALIGYIAAGWWMFYDQHFWINDELNRIADAVYVTVGRDPHLGAIGFYWPPLPQLLNCIFVPILEPFGRTIMAGPVETAFCMAFTIPVLAKIGSSLRVGRWTTFAACLVFALTPVAIYNSTNGMSEAAFFLTGSIMMLGFLRYIRSHSTGDMILLGAGMSAFILTRLEGPFVVAVLVFVASFEWHNLRSLKSLRQSAWTALLLALPPYACFGFWVLAQWILLRNPLFFLQQNAGGTPPTNAAWLPKAASEPFAAFPWALHWVLVLGIPLYILLAGILVRPFSDRTRGSIGIVGAMGAILAIQIYSVGWLHGYGDPRYFSMAVPFGFVAAFWLFARSPDTSDRSLPPASAQPWSATYESSGPRVVWNAVLIAVLVVNAGTGSWTMSSGTTTAAEHECVFFQGGVAQILPFLGRGGNSKTKAYCPPDGNGLAAFQSIDHILDDRLRPSDRVLADNASMFAADLFTRHPDQFIVRNDRDWEKISANPAGKVEYIITQSPTRRGRPEGGAATTSAGFSDYGAQIINLGPKAWKLVAEAEGAQETTGGQAAWIQLYEATGVAPAAGINGPTGQ
jgi:hypothetical protein